MSDTKSSTQAFLDVLCAEIAKLEKLEDSGESAADTREMLDELHEFVDRLNTMYFEHVCQTAH